MPCIKTPIWIGDTIYKICPKCNERHNGSCAHCAWSGTMPHGCDVGPRIWPDGSCETGPLQILKRTVTEANFFTVCRWFNIMYFASEELATLGLEGYNAIRAVEDKKQRYAAYLRWAYRHNPTESEYNIEVL